MIIAGRDALGVISDKEQAVAFDPYRTTGRNDHDIIILAQGGFKMQDYWYNYDSGEYDLRSMPETDEDAIHYIPITERGTARSLYGLYRETGLNISEAMLKTLEACCGVKHTEAANE